MNPGLPCTGWPVGVEDIRVERIEATPLVDPPQILLRKAGRDTDLTRKDGEFSNPLRQIRPAKVRPGV